MSLTNEDLKRFATEAADHALSACGGDEAQARRVLSRAYNRFVESKPNRDVAERAEKVREIVPNYGVLTRSIVQKELGCHALSATNAIKVLVEAGELEEVAPGAFAPVGNVVA